MSYLRRRVRALVARLAKADRAVVPEPEVAQEQARARRRVLRHLVCDAHRPSAPLPADAVLAHSEFRRRRVRPGAAQDARVVRARLDEAGVALARAPVIPDDTGVQLAYPRHERNVVRVVVVRGIPTVGLESKPASLDPWGQ